MRYPHYIGLLKTNRITPTKNHFIHPCRKHTEVYIKSRSSACVYFNASKEQVEALLEQARPSFFILGQLRMETLAEAMLYAGSKKYSWFDTIKQRQANIAVMLKKNPSTRQIAESVEKAKTANAQNTGLMTETIGTSLGVCANTKIGGIHFTKVNAAYGDFLAFIPDILHYRCYSPDSSEYPLY